jgi:hypothetical protein
MNSRKESVSNAELAGRITPARRRGESAGSCLHALKSKSNGVSWADGTS